MQKIFFLQSQLMLVAPHCDFPGDDIFDDVTLNLKWRKEHFEYKQTTCGNLDMRGDIRRIAYDSHFLDWFAIKQDVDTSQISLQRYWTVQPEVFVRSEHFHEWHSFWFRLKSEDRFGSLWTYSCQAVFPKELLFVLEFQEKLLNLVYK